jgi:N-acetylglucosamine-6-phosphate deacetylase
MSVRITGLVDLQVNGYKGVNFAGPDLTSEDFLRACKGHFEAGTTALLATVVTSPRELYKRNLPLIAEAISRPELKGRVLGMHIEGPFISSADGARGAHNANWVRRPNMNLLDEIIAWADGKVRLLTIAAELDGAAELARHAVGKGIAVSLGHQMATASDLQRLAHAGATALTHLGNGIPAQIDRHENPIWPALANDNLTATIITDGNHLPPSLIKTIIRAKTPYKCIVISDASELSGLAPGRYESMGHNVILEESGRLYDPKTGYLAGSSATMLQCMNHLASLNLLTLEQMTRMAFENPLSLIGLAPSDVNSSTVCYDRARRKFYCEQ